MKGPIVVERSRGLLRVTGRQPVKMIDGLATADIQAVTATRGAYTTFLTPKGRMVADARVFRTGEALLIDTASDALPGLVAHISKYVPPLFARVEDVSGVLAVVGVYGAGADEVTAALVAPGAGDVSASGSAPNAEELAEEAVVPLEGGFRARTLWTGEPGWDVFVDVENRDAVVEALLDAGGQAGDPETLETLRVAAGRPRWGRELTEDVIPLEAELLDRAIDQGKGCYTGQEVIVRILHRGHVNRHLRRLEFTGTLPSPGTELFEPGNEKARGVVTSAIENEAGALGLGYVRREVEPPADLHVGSPDGDPVRITALD